MVKKVCVCIFEILLIIFVVDKVSVLNENNIPYIKYYVSTSALHCCQVCHDL